MVFESKRFFRIKLRVRKVVARKGLGSHGPSLFGKKSICIVFRTLTWAFDHKRLLKVVRGAVSELLAAPLLRVKKWSDRHKTGPKVRFTYIVKFD